MKQHKITQEMIEQEISKYYPNQEKPDPIAYFALTADEKSSFYDEKYMSAIDSLNRKMVICSQTRIMYHIETMIDIFESIGLITDGETLTEATTNNVGSHLYTALTNACDTIIQQYIPFDNNQISNDDIENMESKISDIIHTMKMMAQNNETIDDDVIMKLYNGEIELR